MSKYPRSEDEAEQVIEAEGKCIVPGLVDAHTHPVWVGDRVHEFAMKVKFYHFDQVNLYHLVRNFPVTLYFSYLTKCSFIKVNTIKLHVHVNIFYFSNGFMV